MFLFKSIRFRFGLPSFCTISLARFINFSELSCLAHSKLAPFSGCIFRRGTTFLMSLGNKKIAKYAMKLVFSSLKLFLYHQYF